LPQLRKTIQSLNLGGEVGRWKKEHSPRLCRSCKEALMGVLTWFQNTAQAGPQLSILSAGIIGMSHLLCLLVRPIFLFSILMILEFELRALCA
jgi:hypothetical protein